MYKYFDKNYMIYQWSDFVSFKILFQISHPCDIISIFNPYIFIKKLILYKIWITVKIPLDVVEYTEEHSDGYIWASYELLNDNIYGIWLYNNIYG
jgi:hypothetical protein